MSNNQTLRIEIIEHYNIFYEASEDFEKSPK